MPRRGGPDPGVDGLVEPVGPASPQVPGGDGAEPMGDAYFGLYLLAMGQGRPRTANEVADLLGRAGFDSAKAVRTANPFALSMVTARRV